MSLILNHFNMSRCPFRGDQSQGKVTLISQENATILFALKRTQSGEVLRVAHIRSFEGKVYQISIY